MIKSRERVIEVQALVDRVPTWAAEREVIRAIALLGSWARDEATADSDVDLLVIGDDLAGYIESIDWLGGLASGVLVHTKTWGVVTERRFRLMSGLELEVDVAPRSWASVDPPDPGTVACVRDGFRILYDPNGLLMRLQATCLALG